jgi:hypothetical protein
MTTQTRRTTPRPTGLKVQSPGQAWGSPVGTPQPQTACAGKHWHTSLTLITLAAVLTFAAGSALAGSTPQPSVGGGEAELGCAATAQASPSRIDGAPCRALAQLLFIFDTSTNHIQQSLTDLGDAQDGIVALVNSFIEQELLDEATTVRLQMVMERRAKLLVLLSNIMQTTSDTQDTLVEHLK